MQQGAVRSSDDTEDKVVTTTIEAAASISTMQQGPTTPPLTRAPDRGPSKQLAAFGLSADRRAPSLLLPIMVGCTQACLSYIVDFMVSIEAAPNKRPPTFAFALSQIRLCDSQSSQKKGMSRHLLHRLEGEIMSCHCL